MRRGVGVIVLGALLAALCPSLAARAGEGMAVSPARDRSFDFASSLKLAVFGETSDASRTLAASYGDRESESPLRAMAFRVVLAPAFERSPLSDALAVRLGLALPPLPRIALDALLPHTHDALAASPVLATPGATVSLVAPETPPTPFTALYQPQGAAPSLPPASPSFDLGPARSQLAPTLSALQGFNADSSGIGGGSALAPLQATLRVPVHVGNVRFQGRVEEAAGQALSLRDNAVGAGANFDVRAGSRSVNVDLADRYEHVSGSNTLFDSSGVDGVSNWQLGPGNVPVLVPAYADVNQREISAGLALPVSRRVTVGVQYNTQRFLGEYGAPGLGNVDARNDVYGTNLTFALPHSRSAAITLSAKQYRYQDNLLPPSTVPQVREDVNLTLKF